MNTLKTVFQSYKKPGEKSKLKIILAAGLGLGTAAGVGVLGYNAMQDQPKVFEHRVMQISQPNPVAEVKHTESKTPVFQGLGMFQTPDSKTKVSTKKTTEKRFAKHRKHAKRKFARKHGKHGKYAKRHHKGHKNKKLAHNKRNKKSLASK